MKKYLLLLSLSISTLLNSQVVLQENFNAPFNVSGSGWYLQNESFIVNSSTTTWYEGDPGQYFNAYNGNPNDYFAADYFSTDASTVGTISNWLITPTVTIYNGAVLEFVTRTENQGNTNVYPDRMQVRMSTAGATSVIPTGTGSVGSFSNLIFDINPNLNTSTVGVANNGIVNGYPNAWTVYTVGITGITGTVTGRFAFRYFVTGGGPPGANSLYIGLDAVKFTLPCGASVPSYTICSGGTATLAAVGAFATNTYSWNNSSTSPSIVVTPASTTVYTLTTFNGTNSCGPTTSTITIGPGLSVSVTASQNNFCSGQTITVSAISGASTYSWSTGLTSSSIVVTPTTTTTYSVGAANSNLSCFGASAITVTVKTSPQLTVTQTPFPFCEGTTSVTINLSGASTYTMFGSSQNPQSVAAPTALGSYTFDARGTAANGCYGYVLDSLVINPNPTVTIFGQPGSLCVGETATVSASGAATYSWSGAISSTASAFTFTSATSGVKTFAVTGKNAEGCKNSKSVNIKFNDCVGIHEADAFKETSIYPNPFTNEIVVDNFSGKIEIYNALGDLVLSKNINEHETINTSALAKSIYILKLYNAENKVVRTQKLVKN